VPERRIVVLDTPDEVANQGADEFEVRARAAIAEHGRFAVALSGGSTRVRTRRGHAAGYTG